ncbi:MAG: hypothetical protein K8I00_02295 [Candidatus Omnitrophica bacterium]|nr:hypothetical protein [Candidatus Omnitrophota bacterium]
MKNKLTDLNDHLFEQLERLNDDELTDEQLSKEIDRSKAMAGIAAHIIDNARLALDAQIAIDDRLLRTAPKMLGVETHDDKKKGS